MYGEKLDTAQLAAEETAALYGLPTGIRLKTLLFAIHTFYAFVMKLIAIELLALQRDLRVASFVGGLAALDDEGVKARLPELESGSGFVERGIVNFLEADFFSWYLDVWSAAIADALRGIVRALADFEPATPVLEPDWTRDLLQKLYESLVPKTLRHGLGEYYTPDWLAGYLMDRTGYDGAPDVRLLDPACGSGTFLVQAIHRAAARAERQDRVRVAEIGRAILDGIVGFDLHPLAVLAARTNYLIAQNPATRAPYPEDWMLDRAPLTYGYLKQFEAVLKSRGSKVVRQFAEKTEFYAMFGIGEYTFARYRVAWKRMTNRMAAAVLTTWKTPFGEKTVVATDTTSLFTARSVNEAHYLCALLNSGPVDGFIRSFSSGGRGFGAPAVVKDLAIPTFDPQSHLHLRLARLSREAHEAVAADRDCAALEIQMDEAAEELWTTKP